MKKTAIFLAILMFSATLLYSCKSHERCPAYGKIEKQNLQKHS